VTAKDTQPLKWKTRVEAGATRHMFTGCFYTMVYKKASAFITVRYIWDSWTESVSFPFSM